MLIFKKNRRYKGPYISLWIEVKISKLSFVLVWFHFDFIANYDCVKQNSNNIFNQTFYPFEAHRLSLLDKYSFQSNG